MVYLENTESGDLCRIDCTMEEFKQQALELAKEWYEVEPDEETTEEDILFDLYANECWSVYEPDAIQTYGSIQLMLGDSDD